MRGHTSGLAVPTYVIDAPGGGGKIPVMPQYLVSQNAGKVVLRNYEGMFTTYTEPRHYVDPEALCAVCGSHHRDSKVGLTVLLSGEKYSLNPGSEESPRVARHHPGSLSNS